MATAVIALGSNIDPDRNLVAALGHLLGDERLAITGVSSFYRSAPIGDAVGPARFINGAMLVETTLAPRELKRDALRPVESALGRSTVDRSGPRPIDLDLVTYDDWIIRETGLSLPDPDWLDRAFIAVPIAELAPDLRHPITGQTAADVARELNGTASAASMMIEPELTDAMRATLIERGRLLD